eukprot:3812834-Amphidinium_carterae.1
MDNKDDPRTTTKLKPAPQLEIRDKDLLYGEGEMAFFALLDMWPSVYMYSNYSSPRAGMLVAYGGVVL